MKVKLVFLSLFFSTTIYAKNVSSLFFGQLEVTAANVISEDVDMYSFVETLSTRMCFTGNAKSVGKIIAQVLDVGTGDSEVSKKEIVSSKDRIDLTFWWDSEDGSHRTTRKITRCQ